MIAQSPVRGHRASCRMILRARAGPLRRLHILALLPRVSAGRSLPRTISVTSIVAHTSPPSIPPSRSHVRPIQAPSGMPEQSASRGYYPPNPLRVKYDHSEYIESFLGSLRQTPSERAYAMQIYQGLRAKGAVPSPALYQRLAALTLYNISTARYIFEEIVKHDITPTPETIGLLLRSAANAAMTSSKSRTPGLIRLVQRMLRLYDQKYEIMSEFCVNQSTHFGECTSDPDRSQDQDPGSFPDLGPIRRRAHSPDHHGQDQDQSRDQHQSRGQSDGISPNNDSSDPGGSTRGIPKPRAIRPFMQHDFVLVCAAEFYCSARDYATAKDYMAQLSALSSLSWATRQVEWSLQLRIPPVSLNEILEIYRRGMSQKLKPSSAVISSVLRSAITERRLDVMREYMGIAKQRRISLHPKLHRRALKTLKSQESRVCVLAWEDELYRFRMAGDLDGAIAAYQRGIRRGLQVTGYVVRTMLQLAMDKARADLTYQLYALYRQSCQDPDSALVVKGRVIKRAERFLELVLRSKHQTPDSGGSGTPTRADEAISG
ncbi:uncharacterized protein BJ171DRAFT_492844 [Polychytrium aggregatum]|uniref:uncharacterized protein n=1 Tax=Polychytrium aggregatum TaxID=110093 RepID=UPI0022FDBCC6|nr:uncharacterized protein BJ171DRAFT_492844 [Polychytrium aggregatum]KAI9207476.1 hypothetical protein BJ171DRAFT_492844 [Polychytrium aggregatum]